MIGTKRKAPDAAPIMVALTAACYKVDGVVYNIRAGERVRSDHPLVKYQPQMFAADGLTDVEMVQARTAYSTWKESVTR